MQAAEVRTRLTAEWHHGEHVDLRGITCEGPLDLAGCAVAGVDFTGARFPEGLDARGARFLGLSWFGGAQFDGAADFSDVVFTNDARFEGARFNAPTRFDRAELRGIGRFDRAVFAGDADFSGIVGYGNFSLQQVRMTGAASFHGSEWLGGLWCQDASLPAGTDLDETQVHGRLWLHGAHRAGVVLRTADFGMSFGYTYR